MVDQCFWKNFFSYDGQRVPVYPKPKWFDVVGYLSTKRLCRFIIQRKIEDHEFIVTCSRPAVEIIKNLGKLLTFILLTLKYCFVYLF